MAELKKTTEMLVSKHEGNTSVCSIHKLRGWQYKIEFKDIRCKMSWSKLTKHKVQWSDIAQNGYKPSGSMTAAVWLRQCLSSSHEGLSHMNVYQETRNENEGQQSAVQCLKNAMTICIVYTCTGPYIWRDSVTFRRWSNLSFTTSINKALLIQA
jgi:hypothetical protein